MNKSKYKTIAVDQELYQVIVKRSKENSRPISGQLRQDIYTLEQLEI